MHVLCFCFYLLSMQISFLIFTMSYDNSYPFVRLSIHCEGRISPYLSDFNMKTEWKMTIPIRGGGGTDKHHFRFIKMLWYFSLFFFSPLLPFSIRVFFTGSSFLFCLFFLNFEYMKNRLLLNWLWIGYIIVILSNVDGCNWKCPRFYFQSTWKKKLEISDALC